MTKKHHKKKEKTEFVKTKFRTQWNKDAENSNNIKKNISKSSIWQLNPQKIIWGVLSFTSLFLVSIYSFVMWSFEWNNYIKSHNLISKDIYINSNSRDNIVIYKSDKDLTNYSLSSTCKLDQKFIKKINSNYIFYFKFLDSKCTNPYLYLKNMDDKIISSLIKVNLIDDLSLINKLTDYKSDDLRNMKKDLLTQIDEYKNYSRQSWSIVKNIDFLEKNKIYKNANYLKSKINYILEEREKNYLMPVSGYWLAKRWDRKMLSTIPNAGRPYRLDTTDWIHHGWDIMAPLYTPVRALSEWTIIRVVNWFQFDDINKKLRKWKNLSFKDKMYNLDVFRWNQIWLKTLKWDIVFYSHLYSINPEIKEWMFISEWMNMWKIWITWVPDKAYSNYHLHFEIAKNPKNIDRVGTYTFEEMMNWDYVWKWLTNDQIFDLQDKLFRK